MSTTNPTSFPGVVLRVSIPSGALVQIDSQHLHWVARYAGSSIGEWHEVLRTTDGLLIEASPVMLAPAPDDDTTCEDY